MRTALYNGLDQEALDLEYSPSHHLSGGLQTYLDQYATLSQRARSADGALLDLAYGPGEDEKLDLFLPLGAGLSPLHVFVHGGFWQSLNQRDFAFIGPILQRQGSAFASVNYTLAPDATIGQIVEQCAQALIWLAVNSRRLRIDPQRITISGHSAGAHICAMLLTRNWNTPCEGKMSINNALLISGVYDLEPISHCYVNQALNLTAAQVETWSPIRHKNVMGSPLTIIWGEHDTAEFKRQSRGFAKVMKDQKKTVDAFEIAGVNHFNILFDIFDR